jgi:hypothetical protein
MNFDEEKSFVPIELTEPNAFLFENNLSLFGTNKDGFSNTVDNLGNIRVLRLY